MQIVTYTGKFIDVCNMQVSDVDIEDIAHSLSMQCRFGGHTRKHYSVAQHCCRVSDVLPDRLKLAGLLHDASEAYVVDLPTPIKRMMPFYVRLEKVVHRVIADAYGISHDDFFHSAVTGADYSALWTEWRELIKAPMPCGVMGGLDFLPSEPVMDRSEAKHRFLDTFRSLHERNKTVGA